MQTELTLEDYAIFRRFDRSTYATYCLTASADAAIMKRAQHADGRYLTVPNSHHQSVAVRSMPKRRSCI